MPQGQKFTDQRCMECSRDPALLRTLEFERAANWLGLKRLIAEYLPI